MKAIFLLLLLCPTWMLIAQQYLTFTPEPSYTSLNNARCITDDDDYLHVVYTEGEQFEEKVMYRRGLPGYFYEDEILLSDYGAYPSVAAENGIVHVVYMTPRFSGGELYYVRSKDDGTSWETPVYLTYTFNESYPSIAVNGHTIHVVWKDNRLNTTQVYYKRSDDSGDTWTNDVLLSNGVETALNPCIAVRENEVHVAWSGDEGIQYLHSLDAGQHWSLPAILSGHPYVQPPTMTISESVVVICWADTLPQIAELVLRRSADSGNTWDEEARLFNDGYNNSNPNIAAEGRLFALVWNEMFNGNWYAVSSFSPDQGRTWSPPNLQFDFAQFAIRPFVTIHDETVHMICGDKGGGYDLAYQYEITDFPFFSNNTLDWGYRIGGDGSEFPGRMIKDDAGNLYISGSFSGTVDFDPTPTINMVTSVKGNDIFIAKYNSSGQLVWVRGIGGLSNEGGSNIVLDHQGNIYVVGEFGGTVDFDPGPSIYTLTAETFVNEFLLKLDPEGNFIWAKNFGYDGSHNSTILSISASDQLIIGGTFRYTADFDPSPAAETILTSNGDRDAFILALDQDGNFNWARSFGGPEREAINDVKIDIENNILITGEYLDSVDFDPGPEVQLAISNGGRDFYFLKLNEEGNFERIHTSGSTGYESGQTIEFDQDGNILLFGEFGKSIDLDPGPGVELMQYADAFLVKLDINWNFIWAKKFKGDFGYQPPIKVDSFQNIYILASSDFLVPDFEKPNVYLYAGDETDIFLLKLTPEGNFIWVNQFNGDSYAIGRDLVLQGADIFITGYFHSSLDLDPTLDIELIQAPNIEAEMFLMKIAQCGPVYNTINVTECEAYHVPDSDEVWIVSGIYHRLLISSQGCDSLLTVNLTILPPTAGSETVSACNEFISATGMVWTTSGVYQETLTNVLGCDSLVTYDLTILPSSALVINVEACNEFISPDGDPTLTSSGTFQEAFMNVAGCDSIVTYNVTIAHDAAYEYAVSACNLYTTPDGMHTWTQSGTYTYILPAAAGCDSTIIVNVTIISLDDTVMELGQSLKAHQENATYQWFDCNSGLPVVGATEQEFYPVISGTYGVIVEAGDCIDTSACYTVILVGTQEDVVNSIGKIYPNPANDHIQIDLVKECHEIVVGIIDVYGRMVSTQEFSDKRNVTMAIELVPGVYAFMVKADGKDGVVKVVVE